MHPFNFTKVSSFICADPDSCFVFDPAAGNKFHWYGTALDKLGTYILVKGDLLYMELEWNYHREQSYSVVSYEGVGDEMTAFVLKSSKTGEVYSFLR